MSHRQALKRRAHAPLLLGLPFIAGALLLIPSTPSRAEPQQVARPDLKSLSSAATESALVRANQEALMRESVSSPLFMPEAYSDFPQTVAPPIVGSLGVSVE